MIKVIINEVPTEAENEEAGIKLIQDQNAFGDLRDEENKLIATVDATGDKLSVTWHRNQMKGLTLANGNSGLRDRITKLKKDLKNERGKYTSLISLSYPHLDRAIHLSDSLLILG